MATGSELLRLRSGKGLSAKELADGLGVNVDRLRKWEQRDLNPRSEDARKILEVFGITNLEELETVTELPELETGVLKEPEGAYSLRPSSKRLLNRERDAARKGYTNRHGVRFEPLTDGTWRAHHKKVPQAAHADAPAGWGDPEYTESLPESTTIVAEPSEDNYATFEVVGNCQDDGTKDAISEGDEVTGRSYPRDMWRYKLPFEAPGAKAHKVRNGKGEKVEVPGNKRHPYWIFIDRQHGIHIGIIKDQDVEKGILYCMCRNPDKKKYPDFQVRMDDCVQILYVVDLKRRF